MIDLINDYVESKIINENTKKQYISDLIYIIIKLQIHNENDFIHCKKLKCKSSVNIKYGNTFRGFLSYYKQPFLKLLKYTYSGPKYNSLYGEEYNNTNNSLNFE